MDSYIRNVLNFSGSLYGRTINNNEYLLSGDTGDKLINVYDIQNNFKKVMYLSGHKRKIVNIAHEQI